MLNIIKIHRLFTHSCKGTVVCSVHCTHNLQNFNSVYPVFSNRHRSTTESAGEKRRNSKISIKSPPPFFLLFLGFFRTTYYLCTIISIVSFGVQCVKHWTPTQFLG
uniref:Uncharacterized protein n=1 Tax=Cacopsylla melanoneura TaxID=428564 RepID=A0A8D8R7G5_9HEMI